MNTLLVSDIHLGSVKSNGKDLLKLLVQKWGTYDKLILVGDVFDDLNFKRIPKEQWELVSFLRGKSNDIEIIWIYGNHDEDTFEVLRNLLGISIHDDYELNYNSTKFIIMHGHQLNPYYKIYQKVGNILTTLYSYIEKTDKLNIRARFDQYFRDNIKKYALKYIDKNTKYNYIICGHSHIPGIEGRYINTGSWVNSTRSYLTINNITGAFNLGDIIC